MTLENGKDNREKHYSAELRHKIDSGETGDKVAVTDPAAAPLGTDSEAGGHTPTSEEVEMALKTETKPLSAKAQGPEQFGKSYNAGASLSRKITVFTVAIVLILIVLGSIYAYWPLGVPR
jgi:hypothetical protein